MTNDANGASAPSSNSSFWAENWDKLVSIGLSLVIGAVAGFFSAVLAVRGDIYIISSRVTALETEAKTSWRPNDAELQKAKKRVEDLERLLKDLQSKNEADALLRDRLRQYTEETRKVTVTELRALLRENP